MGLGTNQKKSGVGAIFADVKGKDGVFSVNVGTKEAPERKAYGDVSGVLTNLSVKEGEFEGNPTYTLVMKLEDPTEPKPIILNASLGTWISAKMVGQINAADLTKPIVFFIGKMAAGTVMRDGSKLAADKVFNYAQQEGTRLVEKYANGATELPKSIEVPLGGGKKAIDMTPVDDAVKATLGEIFAKMKALAEVEKAGMHEPEEGIDMTEAAEAAGTTEAQRAAMSQRG